MSQSTLTPCGDKDTLREAVANRVQQILETALRMRERASLAVAGGSTPRLYLPAIARLPLPWSHLDITLTDERWVPPDDSASNEVLLRETLLIGAAAEARLFSLKTPDATAEAALATIEQRLALLAWPLDLVLLGVGDDGHIASLFPGMNLSGDARVVHATSPLAPYPRVSLSLAVLATAQHAMVIATGPRKIDLLERVRGGEEANLPIAQLCAQARHRVEFIVCG